MTAEIDFSLCFRNFFLPRFVPSAGRAERVFPLCGRDALRHYGFQVQKSREMEANRVRAWGCGLRGFNVVAQIYPGRVVLWDEGPLRRVQFLSSAVSTRN